MATPPMCTFVGGLVLTAPAPGPAATGERANQLPSLFGRTSPGPLIGSEPDACHPIASVKNPPVFRYRNRRPVCMTTPDTAGAGSLGGSGTCLMPVEAPATGSDWRRCFRVRTAAGLSGTWTPPADAGTNACIRSRNLMFQDGMPAWTEDFSRGGMIRDGNGQTFMIDPCRPRRLYQGLEPAATDSHAQLPWRTALLTQTRSSC